MSKEQTFPSILFVYNAVPEETRFYLIPADAEMSVNLRKAIIGINGLMVNASDVDDDDDKLWKHWAYVNAAITEKAEHLSNDNQWNENRFHGHLRQFQLEAEDIGAECPIISVDGDLMLVRAGIIM